MVPSLRRCKPELVPFQPLGDPDIKIHEHHKPSLTSTGYYQGTVRKFVFDTDEPADIALPQHSLFAHTKYSGGSDLGSQKIDK